jgi:hypothetical protein
MHIHPSQINLNAELNALYDLQRAEAKRETDRTRKKLLDSALELEGDSDSYVVRLGEHAESEEQGSPENQQEERSRKNQEERRDPEGTDSSISDWA